MVHNLRENAKLKPSMNLEKNVLEKLAVDDGWIEAIGVSEIVFPEFGTPENPGKINGNERQRRLWETGTQHFMDTMIKKITSRCAGGKLSLYRLNSKGDEFIKSRMLHAQMTSMPQSTFRKVSFGARKPDGVSYCLESNSGPYSIVSLQVTKGRYSDGAFCDADVGQILDMAEELMSIQKYRGEITSCLCDGYRFQYFRTLRDIGEEYIHEETNVFLGLKGWQVGTSIALTRFSPIPSPYLHTTI